MATAEERASWQELLESAPPKTTGKPSAAEIADRQAHAAKMKTFLSKLSKAAVQDLRGMQTAEKTEKKAERSSALDLSKAAKNPMGQQWDYALVVDFEATCDAERGAISPQEIIEFPVALVNLATLTVDSTFHFYVKPIVNPTLTPFCTELTGVTQDMVDSAMHLQDTLHLLGKWMEHHCLDVPSVPAASRRSFLFVSCGDWDLNHLRSQCKKEKVPEPLWIRRICNLKYMYEKVFGTRDVGMAGMLEGMKLPLLGKHHCGIDDVRNITAVMIKLISEHHVVLEPTPDNIGRIFVDTKQVFLGPSNAELGLTPRDFVHGADVHIKCLERSADTIADSNACLTQDLDALNDTLADTSYVHGTSWACLEDYELCQSLSTAAIEEKRHPHLKRWFEHMRYLLAVHGHHDPYGRPISSSKACKKL